MTILRGFRLRAIFLLILSSCIFTFIFPYLGYCDEWVYVDRNIYYTIYYNSSSVKIDEQNKTIQLLDKFVYTKKGKIDFFVKKNQEYIDIDHSLTFILLDFKEWKFSINRVTYYSKSGNILLDGERQPKWHDIKKGSETDILLNKILQKYNIQR